MHFFITEKRFSLPMAGIEALMYPFNQKIKLDYLGLSDRPGSPPDVGHGGPRPDHV
jgi:hypothetical protein